MSDDEKTTQGQLGDCPHSFIEVKEIPFSKCQNYTV